MGALKFSKVPEYAVRPRLLFPKIFNGLSPLKISGKLGFSSDRSYEYAYKI